VQQPRCRFKAVEGKPAVPEHLRDCLLGVAKGGYCLFQGQGLGFMVAALASVSLDQTQQKWRVFVKSHCKSEAEFYCHVHRHITTGSIQSFIAFV